MSDTVAKRQKTGSPGKSPAAAAAAKANGESKTQSPAHKHKAPHSKSPAPAAAAAAAAAAKSPKKAAAADPKFAVSADFLRTLLHTPVQDVSIRPPNNTVFFCTRNDKVSDVWKGLITHNFLSCPVLQKTDDKYYGFIDMLDLVKYFIEFFGKETISDEKLTHFQKLFESSQRFQEATVDNLIQYPLSRRNPYHPLPRGFSLLHAFEMLARYPSLHRVPIIDNDDHRKLINVVTQSQLIEYVNKHYNQIGARVNKPIGDCAHVFNKRVITANDSETAMQAFERMVQYQISGLAVVDEDEKVVGHLSVRDLKTISHDGHLFWRLDQTLKNFLHKLVKDHKGSRPHHAVMVKKSTTFGEVIKRLADNHLHRLFVVDDLHKPIGEVSIKDVLLELLS